MKTILVLLAAMIPPNAAGDVLRCEGGPFDWKVENAMFRADIVYPPASGPGNVDKSLDHRLQAFNVNDVSGRFLMKQWLDSSVRQGGYAQATYVAKGTIDLQMRSVESKDYLPYDIPYEQQLLLTKLPNSKSNRVLHGFFIFNNFTHTVTVQLGTDGKPFTIYDSESDRVIKGACS